VIYRTIQMDCDRDGCPNSLRFTGVNNTQTNRDKLILEGHRLGWEADRFHQYCPDHRKATP
jgi:hypothetical protein